jgi:hypothetical protein
MGLCNRIHVHFHFDVAYTASQRVLVLFLFEKDKKIQKFENFSARLLECCEQFPHVHDRNVPV